MNRLAIVAALLLWCMNAGAAPAADVFQHPLSAERLMNEVLPEAARLLRDAQVVRGQFVYRKFLPELSAPLESSGEYLFAKNYGLVWHTQQPFDSEFVMTQRGMQQRGERGSGESPAMRTAARIFLSLLSLDLQALRSTFELYGRNDGQRWQLGLRPVSSAVAAVFREGVISGAAQLETVVLHDANGDRTEIVFKNTRYERAPPGSQDLQRFAP